MFPTSIENFHYNDRDFRSMSYNPLEQVKMILNLCWAVCVKRLQSTALSSVRGKERNLALAIVGASEERAKSVPPRALSIT